jgi:hypothetical protein
MQYLKTIAVLLFVVVFSTPDLSAGGHPERKGGQACCKSHSRSVTKKVNPVKKALPPPKEKPATPDLIPKGDCGAGDTCTDK